MGIDTYRDVEATGELARDFELPMRRLVPSSGNKVPPDFRLNHHYYGLISVVLNRNKAVFL